MFAVSTLDTGGPMTVVKGGINKNRSKFEILQVNHPVFKVIGSEGLYLQSHQFPSQRDGPVAFVTLVSQFLPLSNQVVSRGTQTRG